MSNYKCDWLPCLCEQSDDAFSPVSILFQYYLNLGHRQVWLDISSRSCRVTKPTEVAATVIASGANINFASPACGRTALHVPVRTASSKASRILGINTDCIRLLLGNGANVNTQGDEGWTAIHEASSGGREEIADLLLQHRADTNSLTRGGQSPLFSFLQRSPNVKGTAPLNKLLGFSSPPKWRDNHGRQPIWTSVLTISDDERLSYNIITEIIVSARYLQNHYYKNIWWKQWAQAQNKAPSNYGILYKTTRTSDNKAMMMLNRKANQKNYWPWNHQQKN